jgi:SAM domain (Sterile alpha motif)
MDFRRGRGTAAMQQIAGWLNSIGMSEYGQRFAENRIDFPVLRDLTDQDLKDLGIVLGDRRKSLRAIAELGSGRNQDVGCLVLGAPHGCRGLASQSWSRTIRELV